jgi:hypothetical protein
VVVRAALRVSIVAPAKFPALARWTATAEEHAVFKKYPMV